MPKRKSLYRLTSANVLLFLFFAGCSSYSSPGRVGKSNKEEPRVGQFVIWWTIFFLWPRMRSRTLRVYIPMRSRTLRVYIYLTGRYKMPLPRTADMMCDPDCRSGSEGESFTCVNKQKYQTLSSVLLRRFIEERWFLKKIIRFARANRVKCFKKRIPSLYMRSCVRKKGFFKTLISFFRANELIVLKSPISSLCDEKGDFF